MIAITSNQEFNLVRDCCDFGAAGNSDRPMFLLLTVASPHSKHMEERL